MLLSILTGQELVIVICLLSIKSSFINRRPSPSISPVSRICRSIQTFVRAWMCRRMDWPSLKVWCVSWPLSNWRLDNGNALDPTKLSIPGTNWVCAHNTDRDSCRSCAAAFESRAMRCDLKTLRLFVFAIRPRQWSSDCLNFDVYGLYVRMLVMVVMRTRIACPSPAPSVLRLLCVNSSFSH